MQNVGFNMGRMPKMMARGQELRLARLENMMETAMQQHLPSPDFKLRAQIVADTLTSRAAKEIAERN